MKPLDPYHRLTDYLWLKVLESTRGKPSFESQNMLHLCTMSLYCIHKTSWRFWRVCCFRWLGRGWCPWREDERRTLLLGLDRPPVLSWISFSLSPFSLLNFPLLCLPLAPVTLWSLTCMLQCSPWLSSTQYEGPKASLITLPRFSGVYCCSLRPFPLDSCIFSWRTSVTRGTEGRKAIKKRQ